MVNHVLAEVSELQLYKGCTFRIDFTLLNDTTYKVIVNYALTSRVNENTMGQASNVIVRKVN